MIELELRLKLFEVRPDLSLANANDMIRDIAVCYFAILADSRAHGDTEWQDFSTFSCLDGVYLSAIYRKDEIQLDVFEADRSFIAESEQLAMIEVDAFSALIQTKALGNIFTLRFPMIEAISWMKIQANEKEA